MPGESCADKISVIMTAYNSAPYVRAAVLDVLAQTHSNLELLVVDDGSTDGTFGILAAIAREEPRLRPLKVFRNRGTYWCKNVGMMRSTGRYVTFQDADDTSDPRRLEIQVRELRRTRSVMCTCNYVRIGADGDVVLNRGLRERKAIMAPMLDKEAVIQRVGYFDSVRTSADAEFGRRILMVFGADRICHVDLPLYRATLRDGSLTNVARTSAAITTGHTATTDPSFLSAPRREYVRQYTAWHERVRRGREDPKVAFPQVRRSFPAPALLLPEASRQEDHITASVASIARRESTLERAIGSIIDQVDVVNVYLNGYSRVPAFLENDRIRVARSQEYGDLRDNGKFFFLDSNLWGYHLTIDDDIVYPADYVQKLLLKIEQYERQAIVGCHGVIFPDPIVRFMEGREVCHFKSPLKHDRFVNLLGTGTVAYHVSTLRLSPEDFEYPGMSDLWLAVAAKRSNVPMIAIERPRLWLKPMADAGDASLYAAALADDRVQTAVMKAEGSWRLDELCPDYPLVRYLRERFSAEELASGSVDLDAVLSTRGASGVHDHVTTAREPKS